MLKIYGLKSPQKTCTTTPSTTNLLNKSLRRKFKNEGLINGYDSFYLYFVDITIMSY